MFKNILECVEWVTSGFLITTALLTSLLCRGIFGPWVGLVYIRRVLVFLHFNRNEYYRWVSQAFFSCIRQNGRLNSMFFFGAAAFENQSMVEFRHRKPQTC